MSNPSPFHLKLVPKEYHNPEYESIALVDDVEEDTKPDHAMDSIIDVSQFGPVPRVKMADEPTAERCVGCGRVPGVVSSPGVDRFDLGVKHALNRLSKLLQKHTSCTRAEADAIVLKLRAEDIELP